jgi:Leucine-rich repeat (LRR) protein
MRHKIFFLIILISTSFRTEFTAQDDDDCESIEDAIKDPSIKKVAMNSNYCDTLFTAFPMDVLSLIQLEVLYLTDHSIPEIPREIAQLKNLKSLSLAGNDITSLPEEIYQMKSLKELILYDNPFSPGELTKIKKRFKKELPRMILLIPE